MTISKGIFLFLTGLCVSFSFESSLFANEPTLEERNVLNQAIDLSARGHQALAIEKLDQLIKQNDAYSLAYLYRGLAKYNAHQKEEAIEDYAKAISLNPELYLAYYYSALLYRSVGKTDFALQGFNKAIEINPHHAAVFVDRGIAYVYKEDYKNAFADFDQALKIDKRYLLAYIARGDLNMQIGGIFGPGRAILDYDKAIKLTPFDPLLYFKRAQVNEKLGNGQQAVDDYSQILLLLREHETDELIQTHYNRAGVYLNLMSKFDEAIADYSKVIHHDPLYVEAYLNRAKAFEKQKNLMLALEDLEKAVEMDPKLVEAYELRGRIYFTVGDYEAAWTNVKAMEKFPNYVEPDFLPKLKEQSGREE